MVEPACAMTSSPAASWTTPPVDWTVTPAEDGQVVAGGSGVTGTQVEESARRDVRRDSQRAGAREYLRVPAGVR